MCGFTMRVMSHLCAYRRDHETLPACQAAFRRFERSRLRVGSKVA
jgi:hypothetical protein